ncbi:hypothetical protein [Fluviispira sanaruensis]|uniref:Uncharacterized protein n=1 Tax=Fluviispira sanaruensis TaxID=2493639 RepID=A0A4P2VKN1_FLUSA|nr:hypothetical protein [Fluviispira sanaruensis]BBH52250.1 hypothetical protein JCM31447_315400 [Fluviispira sanaruensis]
MIEELELQICDTDFKNSDIDFLEIELNPPVTEEDIRYAQLEELIFRERKNEFTQKQEIALYSNSGISGHSFKLQ